jgi:hypothetical protein
VTTLPDIAFETGVERPPTGRQSFYVTSTLMQQADAGNGTVPLPTGHKFTMVIDWDGRVVIFGSGASAGIAQMATSPAGATTIQPLNFNLGSGLSVTYQSIDFSVDPLGLLTGTGHGMGFYLPSNTDVGSSAPVTMSLRGLPDEEPPQLSPSLSGASVDPFSALTVSASEPLPPGTSVRIVDQNGAGIDLTGLGTPASVFVSSFVPPMNRMWRYSDTYTLMVTGVLDFAGNAPSMADTITFRTAPPPPLAAEDGFESVTGTTFAGAQVLAGAGAPVIAGAQSLYIPSLPAATGPGRGSMTQLALRVALEPADTVVRFSYRSVNGSIGPGSVPPYFMLGSEGGQITGGPLAADTGATETVTIPGGGQVQLGPLTTATLTLPPDAAATGQVTLLRTVSACCPGGRPAPAVGGIIIDDLVAE